MAISILYPHDMELTIGVDCSGFVSRAWGLTTPYITSNISLITK